MSKLPRDLKPNKIIKALEKTGFVIDHVSGGHYILIKGNLRTTVPYHKTVKTGTLKSILNQAGLTIEEFTKLLWLKKSANLSEFVIVPRGVEHRPVADEEVEVLLFEPAQLLNTGNIFDEKFTALVGDKI